MNICVTDSVDSVVSKSLKAARVLSKHGIDYCSDGGKSIKEACAEANITFRKLMRNIQRAEMYRNECIQDITTLSTDALTEYVERYYHTYTYENIAFIRASIARLVRRHGKENPELEAISALFEEMSANITIQMQHEEMIVFPYIREMVRNGGRRRSPFHKTVGSPIQEMIITHQKAQPYLRRLAALTNHYAPPCECGNAYRITYDALRDFDRDLHQHVAVEDIVLFPKALELEERFNRKTWLVSH